MRRGLGRLLRLRALLEDLSGVELRNKTAELRQLEEAARLQRRLATLARGELLRMLTAGAAPEQDWATGATDAELLRWNSGRLAALAEAKWPVVEAAREELMARRTERLQIESLVSAAARAEQVELLRRDQKRLDDWFRSRSPRKTKTP